MKTPLETGAPANAKLLERHAADAEAEVMRVKAEIATLTDKLPQIDGDTERTKDIQNQLQARRIDLNDAYDLWFKLSKQVREYDKAVDTSRREGEKIMRSEVEDMITQIFRFDRIAFEVFLPSIAQEALRSKDEIDFASKFWDNLRTCREGAIMSGVEHDKFPEFVKVCYARSL